MSKIKYFGICHLTLIWHLDFDILLREIRGNLEKKLHCLFYYKRDSPVGFLHFLSN
jgi:hypothetical protein